VQLERESVVWQDHPVSIADRVALRCWARAMNVIPFRRERARHQFARPVEPPAALGAEMSSVSRSPSEDDFEDRRRMQQNLAAFLLIVALLVAGAWTIERLKAYSRTLACLEAGHRYCTVLDPRHLPGR
jgi:hypothetical protein